MAKLSFTGEILQKRREELLKALKFRMFLKANGISTPVGPEGPFISR
ncbi:hypothetical protein [Pontibacter roseus]|nr:hypothetical protein [Pontibacter roseus]